MSDVPPDLYKRAYDGAIELFGDEAGAEKIANRFVKWWKQTTPEHREEFAKNCADEYEIAAGGLVNALTIMSRGNPEVGIMADTIKSPLNSTTKH